MKACLVLDLGIAIILYADEWRHEGEGNLFLKNWSVGDTLGQANSINCTLIGILSV
jgi:hypothetical protein